MTAWWCPLTPSLLNGFGQVNVFFLKGGYLIPTVVPWCGRQDCNHGFYDGSSAGGGLVVWLKYCKSRDKEAIWLINVLND